jgi:hypothetical protein
MPLTLSYLVCFGVTRDTGLPANRLRVFGRPASPSLLRRPPLMPIIHYDVSDVPSELTEETARFIARAHCVDGVRRYAEACHGGDVHRVIAAGVVASRDGQRRRTLLPASARLLRVAWQTEAAIRFADLSDDPLLQRVNAQTVPVQTYYAVFNGFRAMTGALGSPVDQHRSLQEDFAKNRAEMLPLPWSVRLSGDPDEVATCRLEPPIVDPVAFNPISTQYEPAHYVWAALRMARRWKVEVAKANWLKNNRRANGERYKVLRSGARSELLYKMRPTTLLDFVYELRRQASYETADEYASDATDAQVARFHEGMTFITDTGLLIVEATVATACGFEALNNVAEGWRESTQRLGAWASASVNRRLAAINAVLPL